MKINQLEGIVFYGFTKFTKDPKTPDYAVVFAYCRCVAAV